MKNTIINTETITKLCDTACIVTVSCCISKLFHDAVKNMIVPVISYDSKLNTTSISFVSLKKQDQKDTDTKFEDNSKRDETTTKP